MLFDQNISFSLLPRIASVFPDAAHVKTLALTDANDHLVFISARQQGYNVVFTQDEDFYNLLLQHGTPPKIIWLRTGNCSIAFLAELILRQSTLITAFIQDNTQDCLEIYG